MAVAVHVYGATLANLLNKLVNYATLKSELLDSTATAAFSNAHTTKEAVDGGGHATVTMTIATPGVVTDTGHGFINGQPVQFFTTGALPTGLIAGSGGSIAAWYYIINQTTNTYQLSATVGGSAIATSGTQSGVHTRYSSGSHEVYGNAWVPGGPLMTGVTFTTTAVNDATLNDCTMSSANVDIVAAGGTIGPAYGALIYDSSTNTPLFLIDFGQAQSAGNTTDFKIVWNASGIFTFTV